MKTSFFKNLRLQTYLQAINSVIPLITTPYIARVLGATQIGVFSSHHSFACFFTLFAVFGTTNYGTRCISAERDETKRRIVFGEIYALQLITCAISSSLYLAYCILLADNKSMAFLQFITLFGCFIEISWYYFGIEDFKLPVTISAVFRVLSVVLLFLFVKTENDLWIYTLIMLISALLSQIVLWMKIVRAGYIRAGEIRIHDVKKHFIPNAKLFIPMLAMTVCNSTDKAMLGSLSSYTQAGYYANIDRVINVPFSIFSGFGTVFLPRITSIFLESKQKAKDFFFDTLSGVVMLGVGISCGIIAVADAFIPFFLGPGYEPCIALIKIFSPVIIFKCISNAIRMHYLVPFKQENIYIKSTIVGAVLNLVLNFFLIPTYGAIGAILTTLVSEVIVLVVQTVLSFKGYEIKSTLKDLTIYTFIGVAMIIVIRKIGTISTNTLLQISADVVIGAGFYLLLSLIYWIVSGNNLYKKYIQPLITAFLNRLKSR